MLKKQYEYMSGKQGKRKKKVIIGVERRLAGLLWTLLRKGSEYDARRFTGQTSVQEMVRKEITS
jgi:hypothetical protein